jgi:cold shock CspA family protein
MLRHPENRRQIAGQDGQVALLGQDPCHHHCKRDGNTYQFQIEDDAGKKALFGLTFDQALLLAYDLDNLLADEEEELHPKPAASAPEPSSSVESLGTVKWYNTTKGFGFVTPHAGGEEVFLHRTVLEQAGLADLAEGTRVRVRIVEGKKGPQVGSIALA